MKIFKSKFLLLALSILVLFNTNCKDKITLNPVKEELPAITQTGANTFGFLLNGEVWLPKAALLQQKLDLSYDPTYKGGTLNIIAKRYFSDGNFQSISMGGLMVSKAGIYDLFVSFNDGKCNYEVDITKPVGVLIITKIDLVQKFISGTFEFKLEKQGCTTINATQGRFDLKIE